MCVMCNSELHLSASTDRRRRSPESYLASTILEIEEGFNDHCVLVGLDEEGGADHTNNDLAMARALQQSQNDAFRIALQAEEESAMFQSPTGRAWKFVESILQLASMFSMETVAADDIVFLAQRFIQQQEDFLMQGKSTHVSIAYHNTKPWSLEGIRQGGLMSKSERSDACLYQDTYHGSSFGDGIYCANNPVAFKKYGSVGLVVATLKGREERFARAGRSNDQVDTVVGNKENPQDNSPIENQAFNDEIVLRESGQCLPLLRYNANMIEDNNSDMANHLWECHKELQFVLDNFFNQSDITVPHRVQRQPEVPAPQQLVAIPVATAVAYGQNASPLRTHGRRCYSPVIPVTDRPPLISEGYQGFDVHYYAPAALPRTNVDSVSDPVNMSNNADNLICPICLDSLAASPCVQLHECRDVFHRECLQKVLGTHGATRCPTCRAQVAHALQGTSPSGRMKIVGDQSLCGYRMFSIHYDVPSFQTKSYHEQGEQCQVIVAGTRRQAFIWQDGKGAQDLLKRLTFAFLHGLTFTVGRSLTCGGDSLRVVWASIHHKTSLPDNPSDVPLLFSNYNDNCHRELDALGVPPAAALPHPWLQRQGGAYP